MSRNVEYFIYEETGFDVAMAHSIIDHRMNWLGSQALGVEYHIPPSLDLEILINQDGKFAFGTPMLQDSPKKVSMLEFIKIMQSDNLFSLGEL